VNLRFFSIITIVVAILIFMVFQATTESRATVLIPSQIVSGDIRGADLSRIRVGGKVSADPIQYEVSPAFVLKFSIHNPGKDLSEQNHSQTIPVVYQGIKPDMFTAGRDVIIDGEYKDGVLQAQKLLTQCPSKYEPPSPEKMISNEK
jgi:cytochrome c-type biogenesis protein CcmE